MIGLHLGTTMQEHAKAPSSAATTAQPQAKPVDPDPVLCQHCGRTANNGLSCIGMCVADSGY
ncbi:MAG: hypothetical protein VKJ87_06095 [Synechococcus sp.]|nr:hypothetical protein [Synechococcus sp.]